MRGKFTKNSFKPNFTRKLVLEHKGTKSENMNSCRMMHCSLDQNHMKQAVSKYYINALGLVKSTFMDIALFP